MASGQFHKDLFFRHSFGHVLGTENDFERKLGAARLPLSSGMRTLRMLAVYTAQYGSL